MHTQFPARKRGLMALAGVTVALALPAVARAEWQRGINLNTYTPNAYSSSDASLSRAVSDGNDSVEIVTTWYSADPNSSTIAPDPARTPSDASILHTMQAAHALGMRVVLKPHVNIDTGSWRGGIHPLDVTAWFAGYQSFIDHYAELAAEGGADMFVVGTELKSMSGWGYASQWQSVIDSIKQRYSGKLTYAANYDEYKYVSFWSSLDYIGVDAYFSLAGTSDPTVASLLSAWTSKGDVADLQRASSLTAKPVLFTEIGYRSEPDTASHPGLWNGAAAYDMAAQANAYTAAFQAFAGKPWFAGMYWWNWPATLPTGGWNNDYPPIMKPAETVMATFNATLGPLLSAAGSAGSSAPVSPAAGPAPAQAAAQSVTAPGGAATAARAAQSPARARSPRSVCTRSTRSGAKRTTRPGRRRPASRAGARRHRSGSRGSGRCAPRRGRAAGTARSRAGR
jgi:hypothetical protein